MKEIYKEVLNLLSTTPVENISETTGVSIRSIKEFAKKYNCNFFTKKDVLKEKVLEYSKQGKTVAEIVKITNVSHKSVLKWIRDAGLIVNSSISKPLSQSELDNFQKLVLSGMTNDEISKKLNMCVSTVMKYVKLLNLETNTKRIKPITNKEIIISDFQMQVLWGSLLGDMGISDTEQGIYYRPNICQGLKQKEYFDYKCEIFKNLIGKPHLTKSFHKKTQKWYEKYSCKFLAHPYYTKIHDLIYINNIKTITEEWLNKITPVGLAFWYMDDGCKSGTLATCCFSYNEHLLIQKWFWEKYGIETTIQHQKNQFLIYIKRKSWNKFENLIRPYIHSSMKYKLRS